MNPLYPFEYPPAGCWFPSWSLGTSRSLSLGTSRRGNRQSQSLDTSSQPELGNRQSRILGTSNPAGLEKQHTSKLLN